jgi:hypothetical protein
MKKSKLNTMKKHSLTDKGLSMSQAQSISNLCNQSAREIERTIEEINNYSKKIKVEDTDHTIQESHPLPKDIVALIEKKGKFHACQAFLMENIRTKDTLLGEAKSTGVDISSIERPNTPDWKKAVIIPNVDENFGWSQLTSSEVNEYLEAESMSSHIGQFIHKGSKLDLLRRELPNIPSIEWFNVEDNKKTPVTIEKHHNSSELLKLHEELAAKHRDYEKRVNYFKAKVKNLTTNENARIAKENAIAQADAEKINNELSAEYNNSLNIYNEKVKTLKSEFEVERQNKIKGIVSLRIQVDSRFQDTVDYFLKSLGKEETSEA